MYYRIQSQDRPNILDPQNQISYSWNDQGDDERARIGVSVCDSREELAEYIAQSGIPFEDSWEILEVEGQPSEDEDEDAHLGARLIIPERIVSRESLADGFAEEILDAYESAQSSSWY